MREDQRRALHGLDDLGHGEGLAGAGDAEQDLVFFAGREAGDDLCDGAGLVALGLVGGVELKLHLYRIDERSAGNDGAEAGGQAILKGMKKTWVIGIVAVVLVGGGILLWQGSSSGDVAYVPPTAEAPKNLPPVAPPEAAFKDTSMLKPPAGAKVAIYEFDDLECPACAHAMPILHQAAAQYKIPLEHHDYPLTEIHIWSFDAAVTARYLQDKVSLAVADAFRSDVFANQTNIASKDDLDKFTRQWFAGHGQAMPFVMDPNGDCSREVKADRALGDRIGVRSTPCIFVVTQNGFRYVTDVGQLSEMIDGAVASASAGGV